MNQKPKKNQGAKRSAVDEKKRNSIGFDEQVIRDRIVEMRKVPASQLQAHPNAWRLHPEHQRGALKASLGNIGLVDAIIARETEDGLQILDGALRAEVMGDELIPVLIVDLDDQEAKQMLATFDPIGDLAIKNDEAFDALLPDLSVFMEDGDIRLMIEQIHKEAQESEKKGELSEHYVPGMDLEPNEHYDYVVVLARNTHEWNVLCTVLGLEKSKRRNRVGVGRGISAEKLLSIMGEQ